MMRRDQARSARHNPLRRPLRRTSIESSTASTQARQGLRLSGFPFWDLHDKGYDILGCTSGPG